MLQIAIQNFLQNSTLKGRYGYIFSMGQLMETRNYIKPLPTRREWEDGTKESPGEKPKRESKRGESPTQNPKNPKKPQKKPPGKKQKGKRNRKTPGENPTEQTQGPKRGNSPHGGEINTGPSPPHKKKTEGGHTCG